MGTDEWLGAQPALGGAGVQQSLPKRKPIARKRLHQPRQSHSIRVPHVEDGLHEVGREQRQLEDTTEEWAEALGGLRTADGRELGGYLRAEIAREFERPHLVLRHMRALDADRQAALTQEASAFPHRHKAGVLIKLAGVGPITATALVAEVFHRRFQSRRHLASYLGLAPTPYTSGESERDQGISKAGNRPARSMLIELAWGWLRHQPGSGLAAWYRRTFSGRGQRERKVGIVALVRNLATALWRFVETGVVPEGVVLSAR